VLFPQTAHALYEITGVLCSMASDMINVPLCTGCGQAAHWRNDDGSYVEFTGRERCAGCGAQLYSDSQQECSGQPEPLQAFCLVKPQALATAMLANPRYRAGAARACVRERARAGVRGHRSRRTLTAL
jgi:predicted amidophosphoribosyltransferase